MNSLPQEPSNNNLRDIPAASGIYKITCTSNKKIYIGSAINLRKRQILHFCLLRNNKHENPKLQNAWNKYGEQAFTFEVLELVLLMSLTAREQYWFNKLKPFGKKGFNIALTAGSNLGMKHTPKSIEKLRRYKPTPQAVEKSRQGNLGKKKSPEFIEKIRKANTGRKASEETIRKLSESHKGQVSWQKGKTVPEKTRLKIAKTLTGRKNPPSEEALLHRSECRKGKPHPHKGKFNPYGPDRKLCTKCDMVKSIDDFYIKNPKTMTKRSHCKKCNLNAQKGIAVTQQEVI